MQAILTITIDGKIQANNNGFIRNYENEKDFLCISALNYGKVPATQEEYDTANSKYYHVQYTPNAQEIMKDSTEARCNLLEVFFSLPEVCQDFLIQEFEYLSYLSSLEIRLHQINKEIQDANDDADFLESCSTGIDDRNTFNTVSGQINSCVGYVQRLELEKEIIENAIKNKDNLSSNEVEEMVIEMMNKINQE